MGRSKKDVIDNGRRVGGVSTNRIKSRIFLMVLCYLLKVERGNVRFRCVSFIDGSIKCIFVICKSHFGLLVKKLLK